jgi:IS30 family transposase
MSGKGASGKENGMYREDLDEQEMIRLFVEEELSLTVVAKQLGCDRGLVKRRLIKNNVEIVRHVRSDKAKDNQPAKNKLFYKYKYSAQKRNYSFILSKIRFEELISQNCYYCNSEPSQIEITNGRHTLVYNGIDRIDSSKGYEEGNVVPCCKYCNQMKSDMDADMFIGQIKKIYNNLK